MEKQKRYRVCIKNAKECSTTLKFLDLNVTYSNGFSQPLEVKEGQEIPFDVLDDEDVRKSFKVGSLKGYLNGKWIEEIPEEKLVLHVESIEQNTQILPTQTEVPPQQILPEVKIVNQVSVSQSEPITDLTKVFSYEDFCKLSHFLKLRFIKENGNIDLLKEISSKTPSSQFKNNLTLRLSNLQVK
jgi:hypothetical protein